MQKIMVTQMVKKRESRRACCVELAPGAGPEGDRDRGADRDSLNNDAPR